MKKNVLKTVLFVLAAAILVAGLVCGISSGNALNHANVCDRDYMTVLC